ncbi:MAG: ABC transporter substrate-binding protein [Clostridiales bacterium]|nr:ABC transporter substrate-binding protein [Clostridiales bacterium]
MKKSPRASFVKPILCLMLAAFVFFPFAGCGKKTDAIKVGMIKGPTGMGAVWLMEQNDLGQTANKYAFELYGSSDEVSAKLLGGQLDIAAVPTNLAALLYNRTEGKIMVAAVHTLGMLYVLENGETIQSMEDLRGKEVHLAGKGGVPQYAFEYILTANGIDPQNGLTIIYESDHTTLATKMTAGIVEIGILPEPNVTSVLMNNPDGIRIALDLTEEWRKAVGDEESELAMGCLVVSREFAGKNPQALLDFLEEYENSINYVLANTGEAAALCEKWGVIPKKDVAEAALPNYNITYIEGPEMVSIVKNFLNVLFGANPQSVGGKMPDEDFYYMK